MKNINKILLISTLFMWGIYTYAQTKSDLYPDELVLRTESQIDIKFRFYRMSDKEVYLKDDLWRSILNIMETAAESSQSGEGIQVIYSKITGSEGRADKVEVRDIENNSDIFLIGSDGVTEILSDRIEFKILLHKVAITFSLNELGDLDMIKELSVESVWDQINLKNKNTGKRNLYKGDGVFKYGKANISSINADSEGLDSIELSAGVGLGYYRDRFVPDLGFKIAIQVPNRLGKSQMEFGALYTQHYFFTEESEGDFELDLNGFLSGYTLFKGFAYLKVGVAFGTLIHRDGSFFEGGTYKFSLFTEKNESKISFTPELIFTNDFKDFFPALKFGLSF